MARGSQIVIGALVAGALAACGGGGQSERAETRTVPVARATAEGCPAGLPGLTARQEDLRDGAALVLHTSNASRVADLRARAQRFARAQYGINGDAARLSNVSVVPIRNGVRIEMVARDRASVGALRRDVAAEARDLSRGVCPIHEEGGAR